MMEIYGVTAGNQLRAPPPLSCEPGTGLENYAGFWDTETGKEIKNSPYSNSAGRTDTEGCCWWGRGALLTRGVCNIGKLNYFIGKKAAMDGRPSLYPEIDFCEFPGATCSSAFTDEMRWTTGLFEWTERVQSYNKFGWNYMNELKKFVDEDMSGQTFIASVNRIFSLGCHAVGCSSREVRLSDERKANFNLIVNEVFDIPLLKENKPTRRPTRAPTRMPSIGPAPPHNDASPNSPFSPPSSGSEPTKNQQRPSPTKEQPVMSPPIQSPSVPSPEAPSSHSSNIGNNNSAPHEPAITVPSQPDQFPNQQPIETIPYFPAPGSPIQASDLKIFQPTHSPTYNASLIGLDANCSESGSISRHTRILVFCVAALLGIKLFCL
mmetsp:Transcript_1730/g.3706  ORF Transcript_1730/g.3706 Transcript_1730/m.3706 type:complete len:378 (-) Transcript_1730:122-1255(-)